MPHSMDTYRQHFASPESRRGRSKERYPKHSRNLQPPYSRLTFLGIRLASGI